MASGRAADTPGGDPGDGKKWLTILVPAAGVAVLVGLVVVVAAVNEPAKPTGKEPKGPRSVTVRARRSPLPVNPTTLSDGTAPGAEDPNLKDLGDGLKYRDLKEGDGEECPPDAHPIMDYAGWLLDGKSFDTSFKPGGRPLDQYRLDQLVKGWQRGVPGMKVGGIRKLVVPPALGYPEGRPGIPPGSTLVFEMELLGLK